LVIRKDPQLQDAAGEIVGVVAGVGMRNAYQDKKAPINPADDFVIYLYVSFLYPLDDDSQVINMT